MCLTAVLKHSVYICTNNLQKFKKELLADNLNTTSQSVAKRTWQDGSFEDCQQNSDRVFMIRVPEPEVINTHPHLEILHETNIKSVQREPSQTEKGD